MNSELILALNELEKTKNIDKEMMLSALETALITAYKKNFGMSSNVFASIDRETGEMRVWSQKTVVETVTDPESEISLEDARAINKKYEIGDVVNFEASPAKFGRIAAQTAKQMIVQKIREAERSNIFSQYIDKTNDILTGIIQKVDKRGVMIDVGDLEGIIAPSEQIKGEAYVPGKRIKVYVLDLKKNAKNPAVMVSRTHPGLVKKLFEKEVPEIADGTVEIKSIAREAGSRTKIAVASNNPNVDPIGACVGQKGARVAAVLAELGEEKIDIIKYSDDPAEFIAASLSPAKVLSVKVDEKEKSAQAIVPAFQLSLAIGKEGQNARLAAKLTGWKIDIKSDEDAKAET